MLQAYRQHVAERAALGIPPLPLDAKQVADLIELIKNPPAGEDAFLLDLLTHRVPPGVDDAAKVKASFLAAVAHGDVAVALISKAKATELLGTMVGGYNVHPLIELLDDAEVAGVAAEALKKTLLMFDFFNDVAEKAKAGNAKAQEVMQSWADAEWFTSRPEVEQKITVTVFKVPGETNTDDLSPAPDAWSRPDIPLHALAMLKNPKWAGAKGALKIELEQTKLALAKQKAELDLITKQAERIQRGVSRCLEDAGYYRALDDAFDTLADLGVTGHRVRSAPGIYVRLADPFGHARLAPASIDPFHGLGKVAALGIKVSRHCTYHGVALNVAMDLEPFSRIHPCGYPGLQTVDLSTIGVSTTWGEAAEVLSHKLVHCLAP